MQLLNRFSLTFIFLGMLLLTNGIAQQTQAQIIRKEEKVVEKMSRKLAPLEVKFIKTKKGKFLLGQKFTDEEDWFQELSVVLENTSNKTITYVEAGFLFPREDSEVGKAPPLYKTLFYGRHPSAPAGTNLSIQPLTLKPSEKIAVTLSDFDFSEVKGSLKRLDYSLSIKTIKFNLSEIYFEDGTGWIAGTWFNRVPEHSNSDIKEQQPFSKLLKGFSTSLNFSFIKFDLINPLQPTHTQQEVCTGSPNQPPKGELGRCGINDGFYSRQCCDPQFPNNTDCYKREAWIRPGYLGETFDTTVYEVSGYACRKNLGFPNGEACLLDTNRIHYDCNANPGGGGVVNYCSDPPPAYACDQYIPETNCPYTIDTTNCRSSPILVDISGNGFKLTDAAIGVAFDIAKHGNKQQVSWTTAGTDDSWLVLDRNGNGLIDNGQELFGNVTAQPSPPAGQERNGFLALAEFDKTKNGGNGDGVIDNLDAVFGSLQLWQDTNHNGISEEGELHALSALNVAIIELGYKESKRTDEYGNEFRYRAKMKDTKGAQVGRGTFFSLHSNLIREVSI